MIFKFYSMSTFISLRHTWLRFVTLAGLILSFSLPVVYADSYDVFNKHDGRLNGYPVCSRTTLAKDVLPADSPRREFDGNLSQFHAYLSCVWWSGGSDVPTVGRWGPAEYPFYNSQCADIYSCVHRNGSTEKSAVLSAGRGDRSCGLNVMDLIIARRNNVDDNGQRAPLANICQAKIQNPIEIICPEAIKDAREYEEDEAYVFNREIRGEKVEPYQQPPNPCVPGSENFYMPYLIKAKAEMR